jgi:hypothetical protein
VLSMAQTKYVYSIADDTLNAALSAASLSSEIQASSIVIALDYISSLGDVLDIYMKDALTAGDKTTLDSVVAAHTGVSPDGPATVVEFEKKTATQKLPIVATHKPEGTDFSKTSHDWSDCTTWFNDSTRVTGETPTLDTGTTYDLANSNIIDLVSGKVSDEDGFSSAYIVKLYDDAVEIDSGDYTVDYVNGKVTLDSAPSGALTADYSYENGSTYLLKPDTGKVLFLEHAEIQFAGLTAMSQIEFQIWAYDPNDLPNKMLVKNKIYKNEKDILNSANLGQGKIQAFGALTNDVLVFPFNYVYLQPLKDSQGLEMRIKITNDSPYTAEFATATFYCISEDE